MKLEFGVNGLIYSDDFLSQKMKIISKDNSIKLSIHRHGIEYKNLIVKYAYHDNGKPFYEVKSPCGGFYDDFRYDSPRAAQFVHAYLTGKKSCLIDVWIEGKEYHQGYLIKCENFKDKINKLLEV